MIVAAFGATSPHVGKQVAYENDQFFVDGLPLTARQVFDFDARGELVWVSEDLRLLVRRLVAPPEPPAAPAETVAPAEAAAEPVLEKAAPAPTESREPTPVLAPSLPTKKPNRRRKGVAAAVAAIVVLIVVVAVVASQSGRKPATASGTASVTPAADATAVADTSSSPSPSATPPLTRAVYMQRLTSDRNTLLKRLHATTASGAAGKINTDAFVALGAAAGDMASTWVVVKPPASLKAVHGLWLRSLRMTGDIGAPQSSDLRHVRSRVASCLAAIERTGALASSAVCSSISADLSKGLWVETAGAVFMSQCRTISFPVLDKEAGSMKGRKLKIYGQVFQIQDAGAGQYWDGYPDGLLPRTTMLVSVTNEGYGMWTDNVDVAYDGALKHVYTNNIVTVWGTCVGQYSYTSVAGYEMTVPLIHAKFVTKQ